MPRVTVTQQNFTAGEISPRLYGRSDLARYMAGAKEITNGICLQHGGVKRRDGTLYVAEAGSASCRLVKYVYTRTLSYCLEFGPEYIRFFTDSGMVLNDVNTQYQIETNYQASELYDLRFTQYGNYLFIAHPNHPLRQLERLADNAWLISNVRFLNNPVLDDVWRPNYALVLDNVTVGTGRVATCPIFRTADYRRDANGINVSRKIYSQGGGEAIITGNNAATSAGTPHTVEIIKEFESTTIEPGNWWMDGQPQVTITIGGSLSQGSTVTLANGTAGATPSFTVTAADESTYYSLRAFRITATNTGGVAIPVDGDILKATKTNGEIVYYTIFNATGSASVGGTVVFYVLPKSEDVGSTLIGAQQVRRCNTGANLATADDVGSVIKLNGGYVRVTEATANFYTGEVVRTLNSSTAPIANSWIVMRPAWSDVNGYPTAVSTYEQRLVAAGTATNPNTIWFSAIGNFFDFLPGTLDDEGIVVSVSGDERAEVSHLVPGRVLTALCTNGEYTFEGGVEKPIAPTNVQIKNQSTYGCDNIRPARIGSDLYFVQRAGKKIRSFRYNMDIEASSSPDITIMSEHLTSGGIKDMTYAAEPESILWLCLDDGGLVSVTVEKDNEVIAFAGHETDGTVLSVCSVPAEGSDVLWMAVQRDNGVYIEKMQTGVYLDSAIQGTASPATATWSGLDHLEGQVVQVIADGVFIGEYTVASGSITLNRTASAVTIGLGYTTTIETLMQDFGSGAGSIHGNSNRIGEVTIRYLDTVGCKINGDYVAFRQIDQMNLDDAPESFTGLHRMEVMGWNRGDVNVTITQDAPVAMHILQVIYKFTSND
jgi:hypothetical protein